MTKQELLLKYPKIFEFTHPTNIYIPKMWIPLVDNLCQELQEYGDQNNVQIDCVQVKEKFGSLRFYLDKYLVTTEEIISKYEKQSRELCQECGTTEDIIRTSGWITYLCESCAHKLNKVPDVN
jgi:hypothetical protein